MSKKTEQEEEYYIGVAFLSIQTGSEDQPTDRLLKFVQHFSVEMNNEKLRPYTSVQIGKPGGGGCAPGQTGCQ